MKKPIEDLVIVLESEVRGEAFFRSVYYAAFCSDRKNKAKVLWQLEAQTKKCILKYFETNQIEIPELRWTIAKGSILGIFYSVIPWLILLKEMLKETEYYLEVFLRLEKKATKKDQKFFQYIVAHEIAIRQFAEI